MIVLVLDEEEGRQVLDRLLSSQVPQQHACTSCHQVREPPAPEEGVDRPTQSWRPWTPEEDAPLMGCAAPLQAREAYRRVFPQSSRSNAAIKARYLALRKDRKLAGESDAIAAELRDECSAEQIEDEIEATGEPAGPIDSEIAAEMEEAAPDNLSCLDPTLAGLRDEDAPTPCECPEEEAPPSPEPEKKPRTRKDAWTPREDFMIFDAANAVEAVTMYLVRVPEGHRTELAIKSRWKYLKKTGWQPEGEKGDDQPLPLHTRVRLLLQGSKFSGCEAEIVRRTGNHDEYIVVPDGAVARFVVTRKDLEALP